MGNEWVMMAITVSSGLSAGARNGEYSKNGANWSNYTSNSNTALIRGDNIKYWNWICWYQYLCIRSIII